MSITTTHNYVIANMWSNSHYAKVFQDHVTYVSQYPFPQYFNAQKIFKRKRFKLGSYPLTAITEYSYIA